MMGVLFLREHNRIARSLKAAYPGWDDERLFQTARNILTVILIKIVVEEYINHISPYYVKLLADPTGFRNPRWYRQNWMAIEFNLLYRWHSLVPVDATGSAGASSRCRTRSSTPTRSSSTGSAACFEDASHPAGGPRRPVQLAARGVGGRALQRDPGARGRAAALQRLPRAREVPARAAASRTSRSDRRVQDGLREHYGSVDEVELYPGLFAEDVRPNAVLPSLIGRLVAIDAFSQAFTNPLLAPRVFNPGTFSPLGWELIRTTGTLSDLLHRNVPDAGRRYEVTMTRRDWVRS